MKNEQPKWKSINMGEILPCQSFLRKKDGEILKLSTIGGVTVGQDCYYLPVDEVINVIKGYPVEESEDERIKKNIIATIHLYYGEPLEEEAKEMIAWLEKQGEHANFRNKIQIGDKVTRNQDGVLVNLSQLNRVAKKEEKQDDDKVEPKFKVGDVIRLKGSAAEYTIKKVTDTTYYTNGWSCGIERCEEDYELVEQKPAEWSDNDEWCLEQINFLIRNSYSADDKVERLSNWVKSLKDRLLPQLKQEWSEEDEEMLNLIIARLHSHPNVDLEEYSKEYEWLKNKLKSLRPQSKWKPSEEMLEALYRAIPENVMEISEDEMLLDKLYQGLKYGKVLSKK